MSERLTTPELQKIKGAFGDLDLEHGARAGFQVHRIRGGYRKHIPDWLLDRCKFRQVIFGHPQAWRFAGRWTAIAYWHGLCKMSTSEIAEKLRTSVEAVKKIIRRLKRRGELYGR